MSGKLCDVRLQELDDNGDPVPSLSVHVDVFNESDCGLRIIMDPFGEDHDVLLEAHKDGWRLVIHPHGQDPAFVVTLTNNKATVEDSEGTVLGVAEYEG